MADTGTDAMLSHASFWDERYSHSEEGSETPTHEWFRSFGDLKGFFDRNLLEYPGRTAKDNPVMLHLGSGDSIVPAELEKLGYTRQICVDFSPKVVEMMTERWKERKGIKWEQMDVRNMTGIADKSIDVAFDKGTFDAMIHGSPWSPPDEVKENTGRYLKEVHRILADGGVFLWVTFRQRHFMEPLLKRVELFDLQLEVLGGKGGAFDYYGWIIRKKGDTASPRADGAETVAGTEPEVEDTSDESKVNAGTEELEASTGAEEKVDGAKDTGEADASINPVIAGSEHSDSVVNHGEAEAGVHHDKTTTDYDDKEPTRGLADVGDESAPTTLPVVEKFGSLNITAEEGLSGQRKDETDAVSVLEADNDASEV